MKSYYIVDASGKQTGPFPGESLAQHGITPQTYVWCEGMGTSWLPAGQVDELKAILNPPAPMAPSAPAGATTPIQLKPGQPLPGMQTAANAGVRPGTPAQQPHNPYGAPQAPKPQPGVFNQGRQPGQFGPQAAPAPVQQPYQQPQPQQPQYGQRPPYGQPQQPFGQPQYGQRQPYGLPQQPYGQPGQQFKAPYDPNMGKPDSYLVWAILTTILCCLPLGIVSIVFASKVDSEWATGNFDAAKENSDKAKLWAIIAAGVGLLMNVIVMIVVMSTPSLLY